MAFTRVCFHMVVSKPSKSFLSIVSQIFYYFCGIVCNYIGGSIIRVVAKKITFMLQKQITQKCWTKAVLRSLWNARYNLLPWAIWRFYFCSLLSIKVLCFRLFLTWVLNIPGFCIYFWFWICQGSGYSLVLNISG